MNPVAVVDVGGTRLRSATWTPRGGLRDRTEAASPGRYRDPDATPEQLRARLVQEICQAVPARPDAVAGVSVGAALDHRTGAVYASAPLWGDCTEPLDLLGELRAARPDVRWHVVNDVTAALLHAAASPVLAAVRKVLLATISTGIACRVIDQRDGRIAVDDCGLQGEIGHLPAHAAMRGEPLRLRCDCGAPSHLAAFSSGPGIRRVAELLRLNRPRQWQESLLGKRIADGAAFEDAFAAALHSADAAATELLSVVTEPVADVVRTALCLDPELDRIVLTGGVAVGLDEHYRTAVLEHLDRAGTYLTGELAPDWARRRIEIAGPESADCLVGAGIAAAGQR
ncbi:ROK family protein [Saccharopolyspora sp. HNM0986]|uniref:ROK family protein n=1 Tax=Saccharopolyspora galaxeae TaxID=2781241 RepID=UPI00190E034E|nr:ROK family protein [Saccharopolyspora sp. HNM0986]MBK0869279.1 ROK family protein [Saccharopolyspora sp. HNM0986]